MMVESKYSQHEQQCMIEGAKSIVLEIFGMFYDEDDTGFTSEGVRDSSLNDLRYSDIKVEAIKDCVPEDLQLDYLFPLVKYHIQISEIFFINRSSFF